MNSNCSFGICKRSRSLYDKRISNEVNGEDIGDEFAGYVSDLSLPVSLAVLSDLNF